MSDDSILLVISIERTNCLFNFGYTSSSFIVLDIVFGIYVYMVSICLAMVIGYLKYSVKLDESKSESHY